MATMRAARIHQFGGPEVVVIDDAPAPSPGHDQPRVRVHAACVNPIDVMTHTGAILDYGYDVPLPATLG